MPIVLNRLRWSMGNVITIDVFKDNWVCDYPLVDFSSLITWKEVNRGGRLVSKY